MKINLDAKYYYIVNDDLKMSKGKIAAQVSHIAMMLGEKWGEIGRAIVLKAPQYILTDVLLSNAPDIMFIKDAGFTEVPAGSLTCVGFKDVEGIEQLKHEVISKLKLI